MLRLITSRKVRLALAVVTLAAAVVAAARLWRRAEERRAGFPRGGDRGVSPAGPQTASRVEGTESGSAEGPAPGAERAPRWPPAPILGTPTEEDLRRYAARHPSAFQTAVERTFERRRTPREPLDEATRRLLVRWGAVGAGLCLFAASTQVLESAVFSNGVETMEVIEVGGRPGADGRCGPGPVDQDDSVARYVEEGETGTVVIGSVCGHHSCEGDLCGEVSNLRELAEAAERSPGPTWPYKTSPPNETYETSPPYETYETSPPYESVEAPDADCRPRASSPRVRALDPKVTRAVNREWRRIERWLEANAPATLRTLGEPARARTIAVAEAQMGLRFPDDLRASLLRHNGSSVASGISPFGFPNAWNLGVRGIRDTWRRLCATDGETGDGADTVARAEWWDGRMIPFGADDSGGGYLVIDSVARDVGAVRHEGRTSLTSGGVRLRSYYGLLRATARALETGGSIGHWKPVVTDGELGWNVVEG
ncbi:SMI1/KNR4 family protein [Streptosporangium sp. NPDC049046]|uniref:SMI1/KNR4 family protein n=1 Tax=Streptosporangium sp. NPDC049046 TaxID=3155031 RepID=UPI00341E97FC